MQTPYVIDIKRRRFTRNPFRAFRDYAVSQSSKHQYAIECDKSELRRVKRKARWHRYTVLREYPKEMARSSNYRKAFFDTYKRPIDGYRCRYCHRKVPDEKIEIDHIYPVKKAKTKEGQKYLRRHGIENVNDPRNLAVTCHRCNRRKAANAGVWLLKARLGKYESYWVVRRVVITALLILIAYSSFVWWQVNKENITYLSNILLQYANAVAL